METTQKTKAIILKREPFNENDSRVFVYSEDFGKLNLIARGTQKLSSKLSSHIEPLNLCEIMVIKGKRYDYLASVVSKNVFSNIKNNYQKIETAGKIVKLLNEIIKGDEKDENIFILLNEFLEILNQAKKDDDACFLILQAAFILKLISLLGYQPPLDGNKIMNIKASGGAIELIKMILVMEFIEITKLNLEEKLINEVNDIILKYKLYIFD